MPAPTLTLSPRRFRALGTGEQGEPSERERCGALLSQVLGAESPLCHLGTTQVGGWVCAEGQAWLERERRIWGQTQGVVVLLGGGEMGWKGGAPPPAPPAPAHTPPPGPAAGGGLAAVGAALGPAARPGPAHPAPGAPGLHLPPAPPPPASDAGSGAGAPGQVCRGGARLWAFSRGWVKLGTQKVSRPAQCSVP